ncbi:MAG: hypothetical protein ACK56F_14410 [bacterium]
MVFGECGREIAPGNTEVFSHSHAVTAGQWVRWCDRDKMAEQCVVICS